MNQKKIDALAELIYQHSPMSREHSRHVAEVLAREGIANNATTTGEWEKRTWIVFDTEKVGFRCSECNTTWDTPTKFCPHCGAEMKGGSEETQVTTKKFFSPEEVRKMSQKEVHKNYQAIMDSMKEWK